MLGIIQDFCFGFQFQINLYPAALTLSLLLTAAGGEPSDVVAVRKHAALYEALSFPTGLVWQVRGETSQDAWETKK